MPNPTRTIQLVAAPDTLVIHAPEPNIPADVIVEGVTHRTQGGSLVQYQTGTSHHECILSIPRLTNSEKNSLDSFFRSHWNAAVTYTDENGNTFTLRFLETTLPLMKVQRDLWTVAIRFQISAVLK